MVNCSVLLMSLDLSRQEKVETHFLNSRQSNLNGIARLDIENWSDIEAFFESLERLTVRKILGGRPPIPVLKANSNVPLTDGF